MSVIAIDGPSASGKSSIARCVAHKLGYICVDSGAFYRAVTWKALQRGIPVKNTHAISRMASEMKLDFYVQDGSIRFKIDGSEPGEELRSNIINENVSHVAANQNVRNIVVNWIRSLTGYGNLVVEGRDIGTFVFPDALCKFFLTASAEERARRRYNEYKALGEKVDFQKIYESIILRDKIDSSRPVAPLYPAKDALIIDSTNMSIEEVVNFIINEIERRQQLRNSTPQEGR
jgi:cytidylate kinase